MNKQLHTPASDICLMVEGTALGVWLARGERVHLTFKLPSSAIWIYV